MIIFKIIMEDYILLYYSSIYNLFMMMENELLYDNTILLIFKIIFD